MNKFQFGQRGTDIYRIVYSRPHRLVFRGTPIPSSLLRAVARLPGKSLHVFMFLWNYADRQGLLRGLRPTAHLRDWGLSTREITSALTNLEKYGFVDVWRFPKSAATVTPIDVAIPVIGNTSIRKVLRGGAAAANRVFKPVSKITTSDDQQLDLPDYIQPRGIRDVKEQ